MREAEVVRSADKGKRAFRFGLVYPSRIRVRFSGRSLISAWGPPRKVVSSVSNGGLINTMLELHVSLDFACCNCSHSVGVTLKCEGKGLAAGPRTVAAVKVPCPTCNAVNQLYFEPSGIVRGVSRWRAPWHTAEPSLN